MFVIFDLLVIDSHMNVPADSSRKNARGPRFRVMDAPFLIPAYAACAVCSPVDHGSRSCGRFGTGRVDAAIGTLRSVTLFLWRFGCSGGLNDVQLPFWNRRQLARIDRYRAGRIRKVKKKRDVYTFVCHGGVMRGTGIRVGRTKTESQAQANRVSFLTAAELFANEVISGSTTAKMPMLPRDDYGT